MTKDQPHKQGLSPLEARIIRQIWRNNPMCTARFVRDHFARQTGRSPSLSTMRMWLRVLGRDYYAEIADRNDEIHALYNSGLSHAEIAEEMTEGGFRITKSGVGDTLRRSGRRRSEDVAHMASAILLAYDEDTSRTHKQICDAVEARTGKRPTLCMVRMRLYRDRACTQSPSST